MNQKAILYTRVSTDEQNNGYSPADQKDKLLSYCNKNNIEVVGFYHDDASGKSFDRPKWKEIMTYLNKYKNEVNYVCFLKWDRFSRNATEAYAELSKLDKLGVQANAIEQPLNLEIPEQKIMLAIYLAAPEVDNDRRALNVLNGIRRAKKEGRWIGGCPKGYKNARNQFNKPVIVPEGGNEEKLVKNIFRDFSSGIYTIEELRKKYNQIGLKISRSSFWDLLRNRVYIGQVFVPKYKNEPEMWVKGIHEPIVDENTFYKVQSYLENRKKTGPAKIATIRDDFPLRGQLTCAKCGKNLTASYSRGSQGIRYPYYHCSYGCKERLKADKVNNAFIKLISDIKVSQGIKTVFKEIIKTKLNKCLSDGIYITKNNQKEIEKNLQRLSKLKELMLDGELTVEEWKESRLEIEKKISNLKAEDKQYRINSIGLEAKLNESVELLENLPKYYESKNTATKQRIIRSIFPSKLIFDENECRTQNVNKAVELILSKYGTSKRIKNKKHSGFGVLSCGVVPTGIEPVSKV